ncbi:interferon regulatory factor 3 [Homo sapiens]|uniref:Isoform 2 of Interferon regulatory factor 3 n=2 Tax=Homo sapiens TaxID=9606 RepID=Q14653-2|nr:interferon regulatory factor 3 isoform 4 [Homo sapiens]KAI2592318.1 interferon regulatory factor 3 [Homo sapiens]KAI4043982.1 interferon regulatory factor 3 [Homo sapiens]BAD89416.1 interferon regulatory factor 3 nirs variant 3 [Homo sapiens]|eukprot:NP_001184053.1 interferon regulatory factor 3 isoform 4 [Homo sapiens]
MGTPKPRILPWLVSQLDLGQLEGVAWVNKSRTRFRIPWKHGLRQDAQQEDFGIFQAWAEATGAYVPGRDKPDLPTWKRNFRSALNRKEGLRLAEDRSKDPHDPHKIYEFVNSGVGDFSQPDTSPDTNGGGSTSDTQEDILDELLGNMVLAPLPDPGPPSLAVAPEPCPQPLRSPSLDNPTPFPNLGPSENPLKRLLVPGEDLITFTEGSGRSPRYALWFCVGESWPQDQPWTKRLVMVKVVPTCLRALVEMARVGGASSLENTVDLHISNSHPLSLTSDQYKAYLQDLVEGMDFQGPGES